ncbi:Detected protein of unknown function [Hibiscus syriacus]|uniref:RING-type domain-containing protein n=1 Tax=Hibiscus syriacus TaxID=106335 RepID=A0A6A3CQ68_HIBSY|nr:LON peptidase N-terminal domain and RING finger protein 3-like [Hibiscus syriacus]KAE8730594.1 Detected protein of unknown function [Hibiscus syriacus]
MESGNRRKLTLFEQMMAVNNGRDTLAGLTLEAILGNAKRPEQPSAQNRTLIEIIRDDESNREKKSWKTLRDKLRLKRLVSSWTSSVHIPASDAIVDGNNRSQFSRYGSFRSHSAEPARVGNGGQSAARSDSGRVLNDVDLRSNAPPSRSFRTCTAGNGAGSSEDDDSPMARNETRQLGTVLALDRALSEREAAAEEPVRMSLMDFLEETELSGPRRTTVNAGDDEEYEVKDTAEASGGMQHTCCVCMVRHKGAAFIPCGHTFCRVCSRELWVQRGNCPLCNGIILEILDII